MQGNVGFPFMPLMFSLKLREETSTAAKNSHQFKRKTSVGRYKKKTFWRNSITLNYVDEIKVEMPLPMATQNISLTRKLPIQKTNTTAVYAF
jgi:hypothetical protein